MFYEWLLLQRERKDEVGALALIVRTDPQFPRKVNRLAPLLRHYDSSAVMRQLVKRAHAEWRRARKAEAQA